METKWKSDKECEECKIEHRKEIIGEIKEVCKGCKKLKYIENPARDKHYKKPRKLKKGR